jgi:hypothetical protein
MSSAERAYLRVSHAKVQEVDPDIFRYQFAPDCMTHACCVEEGAEDPRPEGPRLDDACCRYGCDVSRSEQAAIMTRQAEIARVLHPSVRDVGRWFDASAPELDEDRGEEVIRTGKIDQGREDGRCVFLHQDLRGCALHRAALESNFPPESIKPAVCRLYPLGYGDGQLGFADDFNWYSCAHHEGPSVYRVCREAIGQVFGAELLERLDELETRTLRRRLGQARSSQQGSV